jgi:hypothetical protein
MKKHGTVFNGFSRKKSGPMVVKLRMSGELHKSTGKK